MARGASRGACAENGTKTACEGEFKVYNGKLCREREKDGLQSFD